MINNFIKPAISTAKSFEVRDITRDIATTIRESGALEGMVTITSTHKTCAIPVNENEERLLDDKGNVSLLFEAVYLQ